MNNFDLLVEHVYNKIITEGFGDKPKTKTSRHLGVSSRTVKDENGRDLVRFTINSISKEDAVNIVNTLSLNNAKIRQEKENKQGKTMTLCYLDISVPYEKAKKWIEKMVPKIAAILKNSEKSDYKNVDSFQNAFSDAMLSTATSDELEAAVLTLQKLEEQIYKAIQENRWGDAMESYKRVINLQSRIYGHQLAGENIKLIEQQALDAGIQPTDKGQNKFDDESKPNFGKPKVWPTFVRNAYIWRNKFGRNIVDEPAMRYTMNLAHSYKKTGSELDREAESMGLQNRHDFSDQQYDAIEMGKGFSGGRGIGYDISDTVPISGGPDTFMEAVGLINNITGMLNPAAEKDQAEWEAKRQAIEQGENGNNEEEMSAQNQMKMDVSTEEGRARIFYDALCELITTGRMKSLKVTPFDKGDMIENFLRTVYSIASVYTQKKWSNKINVDAIAQMVTAAVAYNTVGADKIKSMGFDFSNTGGIFSSYEQCKSSVIALSDMILNNLQFITSQRMGVRENVISRNFYQLLERMDNLYKEEKCVIKESPVTNSLIQKKSPDECMKFLMSLGLNFDENNGQELVQ